MDNLEIPRTPSASPRIAFASIPPVTHQIFPEELPTVADRIKARRRRSIIREFSLNTSTHGLPGMARSESKHNFAFWLISFLVFTGIMIYFVTKSILDYFEYPTQSDVNVIREWPQYFPAVSICNSAIFRLDTYMPAFIKYIKSRNISIPSNMTTIPPSLYPFILTFAVDKLNSNETLTPYFFSLQSMLKKCTYNNLPCSTNDFIRFTAATHGLCYTFNAKMKNDDGKSVRYSNQDGRTGVLELELYVHSHLYPPSFFTGNNSKN